MSLAIIFGLLSAILFGASDILARFAGRRVGVIRSIFLGHLAAAITTGAVVLFEGIPEARASVWLVLFIANVLSFGATVLLYRALTIGRLSVVSPVTATYGGVSAVLSLLSGESFSPLSWAGLAAAFSGGLLAATPRHGAVEVAPSVSGAQLAAGAALLYGVGFWLQGEFVVPRLGVLVPTWAYYSMGSVSALAWGRISRREWGMLSFSQLRLAVLTSAFACLGSLALAAGQVTGQVAITTLLSALASAVTVLLARAVLHESVPVHAWAGLALVLIGLALLRIA